LTLFSSLHQQQTGSWVGLQSPTVHSVLHPAGTVLSPAACGCTLQCVTIPPAHLHLYIWYRFVSTEILKKQVSFARECQQPFAWQERKPKLSLHGEPTCREKRKIHSHSVMLFQAGHIYYQSVILLLTLSRAVVRGTCNNVTWKFWAPCDLQTL
jgi:hypothetical protein